MVVPGQLGQRPHLNKKKSWVCWLIPVISVMVGGINSASRDEKQDPSSKITRTKRLEV
jgi:hypothetical protein